MNNTPRQDENSVVAVFSQHGGLFRPDRRNTQGDRRQSEDDRGVQGRRSRRRPDFPRWLHDREAAVEAEEEHGGPFRRGGARCLFPGIRHGKK